MGRQDGFYWVCCEQVWEIALWRDGCWWASGEEISVPAAAFNQVDERRLVRPDEVK